MLIGLGSAVLYGATLEAVPTVTHWLRAPATVGIVLAAATATLGVRWLGVGTSGLLAASWVVSLGRVIWIDPDPSLPPPTSVNVVDWFLVHASWPTSVGEASALVVLLVARRLETQPERRTVLGVSAVWLGVHLVGGLTERLAAQLGVAPALGASASLIVHGAAAVVVLRTARRGLPPPVSGPAISLPQAWLPCLLVLALGPPTMIRAALAPGLETAAEVGARLEAGSLDPWSSDTGAELPPEEVLVLFADGRRLAVRRGSARELAAREVWMPRATARAARIVPDVGVTARQLIDALRHVGTSRVGLAAITYHSAPWPLAQVSVRAAAHRITVAPVGLVLHPTPLPSGIGPCLDLTRVPPNEPLWPRLRGVECVANARTSERTASPPSAPSRPWLPARPSGPPLLLLGAVLAWVQWRQGVRWASRPAALAVLTLSLASIALGATVFRTGLG